MGWNFRRSHQIGGFRVNLSKSGVSYSFGGKGFRVTKTALGSVKATASIPGTGLSYTKTYSNPKQQPSKNPLPAKKDIVNENVSQMVSTDCEHIIRAAKLRYRLFFLFLWAGIILTLVSIANLSLFLVAILCYFVALVLSFAGRISLSYVMDSDFLESYHSRLDRIRTILNSKSVWIVSSERQNTDRKRSAGAGTSVTRNASKIKYKSPFPFKADCDCITIISGNEKIIFLPDKLFIIQGFNIGAVDYSEIHHHYSVTRFVESGLVPRDTEVVGYTWKFANKSGGPDKRFSNNKKLPICLYGELSLVSNSGLNTKIMFSNASSLKEIAETI